MRFAALLTNAMAASLAVVGVLWPIGNGVLLSVGLFALSGALTNWLAIHMLFERVPLLYGSGVIPNRFAEFKAKIRALIMDEFFTPEGIDKLVATTLPTIDLSPLKHHIRQRIDLNHVFDSLAEAIMTSNFATMLNMFGGKAALEPMREPMTRKLAALLDETLSGLQLDPALIHATPSADWQAAIERVIDERLNALTPDMVKEMLQRIMREHLGWLVIWGGAFGGLLGLVFTLFQSIS
jgi:uncharacterized membrane protein YheB (UPF0754 family)